MRCRSILLCLFVLAGGCTHGWELIGQQDIPFRLEQDVIQTRMDGRFRQIVLEVGDADVEMLDLRIELADGQSIDVPVRHRIAAATRTRVIDLPGGERVVRDVQLTYRGDARVASGRARVFIYGQ